MIDKVHRRLSRMREDGRLIELLKGSGLVLMFKILGALGGYVFAILISTWAGPSGYGVFELATTAIMIVAVVSRLGLESAIVKYISSFHIEQKFGQIRRIYGISALAVMVLSTFLGLLFVYFADTVALWFSEEQDVEMLTQCFEWIGYLTPVFALLQLNAEALRGLKRMGDYSLLQNGTIMLLSVLFLWLLMENETVTGLTAVQAYAGAIVILTLVSFVMLLRSHKRDLNGTDSEKIDFKQVLRTAFPMFVSGSVYLVMSWTDTLMVGAYMNDESLGVYRFAFKMATLITFAQFAINSIAAPMISGFSTQKNVGGLRSIIHQISWLNLALSFPVFVVFFLFPEWVLETAVGESFVEGATSLRILAVGQVVNALCGPVMNTLNMSGYEKDTQRIMLWTAGLNLVLNFIAIPSLGITGAAIATTISMVIWNLVAGYKVYRYFNIISLPIPWRWRPK